MLGIAERALFTAKRLGRDRVEFAPSRTSAKGPA
jgi:hypothetical protein